VLCHLQNRIRRAVLCSKNARVGGEAPPKMFEPLVEVRTHGVWGPTAEMVAHALDRWFIAL